MNHKSSILVVDDEEDFTNLIQEILQKYGYQADKASTGYDALQMLSFQSYDLVILDLIMPKLSGLETLKRIKKIDSGLPVIILTGDARIDTVVEAMKLGAYDYLSKPLDWKKLQIVVKNALLLKELEIEVSRLKSELKDKYGIENIIGSSPKMQEVFRYIEKVFDSEVTVCIRGESGTGKELLARAIHFNGSRRHKPFIAVNCATIPETLLESELFGHEKGAFTGATTCRIGKFEQANGGTLFLDEIGEMSPTIQVKLLRVLQEKKFERLGGNESIEVDVRVISATNKNLEEAMRQGRFREDLYYRINVYPIFIPPLRERREDIPALVSHFVEKFNKKNNTAIKCISNHVMEYLTTYHWPGNVRELENVLERATLNAENGLLLPEHLPLAITSYKENLLNGGAYMDLKKAVALSREIVPLKEIEKEILKHALKLSNYNMSTVASKLGIGRTTLYRKLQRYKIKIHKDTRSN